MSAFCSTKKTSVKTVTILNLRNVSNVNLLVIVKQKFVRNAHKDLDLRVENAFHARNHNTVLSAAKISA